MKFQIGVKFTHDGAVAIFDEDRLIASHEREKYDNSARHSDSDILFISRVLKAEGIDPSDVERVVVDGWAKAQWNPHLECNDTIIHIADYGDEDPHAIMDSLDVQLRLLDGLPSVYTSRKHVAGHLAGSYATSPFAAADEPAYVAAWDGGTIPRLFHVRPGDTTFRHVADLGRVYGSIYSVFPLYFAPFRKERSWLAERPGELNHGGVAGKSMAYAGLGDPKPEWVQLVRSLLEQVTEGTWEGPFEFTELFLDKTGVDPSDPNTSADAIAAFDVGLGTSFVSSLQEAMERDRQTHGTNGNVCLSGGCALNLRWNTEVRNLPSVDSVWVPPFPDDSGGAIGTMMADRFARIGAGPLQWNVYSGPRLTSPSPSQDMTCWPARTASPSDIGRLLHETGRPIIVMHGRAELGPRALGNRSILCAAGPNAKSMLNDVKQRAHYRPVAPVCLEEHTRAVFAPGGIDPYMLFTHEVRPEWRERVPAITHVDGTARLQSVSQAQNPILHEILSAYHEVSGIPVLCNTSANHNGRGFFPGPSDAIKWGHLPVWDGDCSTLYET